MIPFRLSPPRVLARWPLAAGAWVALALLASAGPAQADFRLCNNTGSRVGIAIGYKDGDGWTTEGWWNLGGRGFSSL